MTKLQLSLAAFLAGFLACGWFAEDTLEQLFREIPASQAVIAYLDVTRLRHSETLQSLSEEPLSRLGNWAQITEKLNLDPASDLEAAVFSLGDRAVTTAVAGEFSSDQLRRALAEAGADCENALPEGTCSLRSSSRGSWFFFPAPGTLVVLSGPDNAAVTELGEGREPRYQSYASEAKERLDGAFLWGVIHPRRFAGVMRDPPEDWINLSLLAKALEKAQRARFRLEETSPAILRLQLIAECATAEQAAEQKGLLAGLSRFLAAAVDAAAGQKGSSEWSRTLRSGQFAHVGAEAVASWSIDANLLLERSQGNQP